MHSAMSFTSTALAWTAASQSSELMRFANVARVSRPFSPTAQTAQPMAVRTMGTSLKMRNLELPAVCDFSVTNVCNAACDFCGFARDKTLAGAARYVDADAFSRALPILRRRGIWYMTLQGGEPLVHP